MKAKKGEGTVNRANKVNLIGELLHNFLLHVRMKKVTYKQLYRSYLTSGLYTLFTTASKHELNCNGI